MDVRFQDSEGGRKEKDDDGYGVVLVHDQEGQETDEEKGEEGNKSGNRMFAEREKRSLASEAKKDGGKRQRVYQDNRQSFGKPQQGERHHGASGRMAGRKAQAEESSGCHQAAQAKAQQALEFVGEKEEARDARGGEAEAEEEEEGEEKEKLPVEVISQYELASASVL